MQRFFIDFQDGHDLTQDGEGSVCLDLQQAQAQAIGLLRQAARDELNSDQDKSFTSIVRDDRGTLVFQARLDFRREFPVD